MAEDGVIPERYPLTEIAGGYDDRTARNVAASDGTLILYFGELRGGTRRTWECCLQFGKPHLLVDACEVRITDALRMACAFVAENSVSVLNVAGTRTSEAAEGYAYARGFVAALIEAQARLGAE